MEARKLEKDLIFYVPGQEGTIFTFQAGNFIDSDLLSQTVSHLEQETETKIEWVEERRKAIRL